MYGVDVCLSLLADTFGNCFLVLHTVGTESDRSMLCHIHLVLLRTCPAGHFWRHYQLTRLEPMVNPRLAKPVCQVTEQGPQSPFQLH